MRLGSGLRQPWCLLDVSGDGELTAEELVKGVAKLKGAATSIDMTVTGGDIDLEATSGALIIDSGTVNIASTSGDATISAEGAMTLESSDVDGTTSLSGSEVKVVATGGVCRDPGNAVVAADSSDDCASPNTWTASTVAGAGDVQDIVLEQRGRRLRW